MPFSGGSDKQEGVFMGFLHTLLQEQVQLSAEEAHKYASSCQLSLKADGYTGLIVYCKKQISCFSELMHYSIEMEKYCRGYFDKNNTNAYIEQDGLQTLVLLLESNPEKNCDKLVNDLQIELEQHGYPLARIVVGCRVLSLADVRHSFRTAEDVMQFNRDRKDPKVIFSGDLHLAYQQITLEKTHDFSAILSAFIDNDMEEMRLRLLEKAEMLRTTTRIVPDTPYPTSIRRTMVEITMMLMHIASDAGVDVEETLGPINPYQTIFEFDRTPEIVGWIVGLAATLNQAMADQQDRRESVAIRSVKEFIQQHLDDPCLSLDTVSTSIGLSPSYFSAFFIRETGTGFRDYVNFMRIEKAKEYLMQGKMTNIEIARCCGFRSGSYFISVFKKYVQKTPKAYQADRNS